MANKELTVYVLRTLYDHEIFMRNTYAKQLETLSDGRVRQCIEKIYKDEIRHCDDFAEILKEMDIEWEEKEGKVTPRNWNCSKEDELKDALDFDYHMEAELERNYMEHLNKGELTGKVAEEIKQIMLETRAHAEIIKVLISEL